MCYISYLSSLMDILLVFLLLAIAFANPVHTASVKESPNDRKRVRNLIKNALQHRDCDTKLTRRVGYGDAAAVNNGVQYTVVAGIGNPPTQYTLLIDTGSSNTWIGANKTYVPTSTSHKTKNNVSITYGSGDVEGVEYLDQLALGPSLLVHNQSIGVATEVDGFENIDGILGIGPSDLTVGTLHPDSSKIVQTVTEKLYTQKSIPRSSFSVSFEPTNSLSTANGELTFGGTDPHLYSGNITYTPIVTKGAASRFWGLQQSLRYGESHQIIGGAAGFYDTGTTLLLLSDSAFDNYLSATGASLDPSTGLLQISENQYSKLRSLHFTINDTSFEFTPNAQTWPRSLNAAIGGRDDRIYLVVSSLGSAADNAPDVQFVCGYTFLERFYTTYDISNKRIGIAATKFTYAETN